MLHYATFAFVFFHSIFVGGTISIGGFDFDHVEDDIINLIREYKIPATLSSFETIEDNWPGFIGGSGRKETLFGYENPEENLISNWDLEEDTNGEDIYLINATGTRVPKANTGRCSYFINDRLDVSGSLMFKLKSGFSSPYLKQNTNYYVSVFVMLANRPLNQMYSNVTLRASVNLRNGTVTDYYIARLKYETCNERWQQLGGDFKTPDLPFYYMEFYLAIDPVDVNYYIDTLSVIELDDMRDNWREVLGEKIDKNRKSDVALTIIMGEDYIPGITKVEIRQQTQEFKFGGVVRAKDFLRNETLFENYRNFALKYFNWAGFPNAFKWKSMERMKRGKFKFQPVDDALDIFDAHNIPVRAHAILWGRKRNNPAWLWAYNGTALLDEIYRRLDYVVGRYKNRVIQWDVNNEYLHAHYYEIETGEEDLLCKLFKRARSIDQEVTLCTNDYELVRNGRFTSAAVNLAHDLQRRNCGIGCFGIQSHLKSFTLPIDPEVLLKRIQISCSAGLPVSITEFSVHTDNVTLRADELEKAITVYFSEECVQGILLWGFSDQPPLAFRKDSALTTGINFVPNEAGQRLMDLISKVWNTSIDLDVNGQVSTHNFRAFHGSYKLIVRNGDKIIHEGTFDVKKGHATNVYVNTGC